MININRDINYQNLKILNIHFGQRDTTLSGWKFQLNNLAAKGLDINLFIKCALNTLLFAVFYYHDYTIIRLECILLYNSFFYVLERDQYLRNILLVHESHTGWWRTRRYPLSVYPFSPVSGGEGFQEQSTANLINKQLTLCSNCAFTLSKCAHIGE